MHSRSPSPAKQIKNFISPISDDKKPLTAPEAANSARLAKDPKKSVTQSIVKKQQLSKPVQQPSRKQRNSTASIPQPSQQQPDVPIPIVSAPQSKNLIKKVLSKVEEEYDSQSVDSRDQESEPLMFIDISPSEDKQPARIALYEHSDPEKVARRFIKQQRISAEDYLEELIFMLTDAQKNAIQQKLSNNDY